MQLPHYYDDANHFFLLCNSYQGQDEVIVVLCGYLIKRLLDLYKIFDEYNAKENIVNKFTSALEDKGVSENVANKIKTQLSDDEIKKATELDILPYIDENATVESVREAIKKAQEDADKNPVDGTINFSKDHTSLLIESDDKSKTVNLADLENIYNNDKSQYICMF